MTHGAEGMEEGEETVSVAVPVSLAPDTVRVVTVKCGFNDARRRSRYQTDVHSKRAVFSQAGDFGSTYHCEFGLTTGTSR